MTTTELYIPDCLYEQKSYDIFAAVEKNPNHILASEIKSQVRVKVSSLEGWTRSNYDCYCVVTLYAFGRKICQPITTAHSNNGDRLSWDEWIQFPITYNELPLDSLLCVDVYDPEEGHVGGTSVHFFTSRGKMKRGYRRYKIHRKVMADGSEDSTTLGKIPTAPWEDIAQEFQMKRIPAVPWMDKLTTIKLSELSAQKTVETHEMYLLVEFSSFANPVFYSSELLDMTNLTPLRAGMDSATTMYSRHLPYYDPDFKTNNPCEAMNVVLSKATHRLLDADVKPNAFQLSRIKEILDLPPIHSPLTSDQVTLLWQFGNYLVRDPSAFVPFMEAVDWKDEREAQQAKDLAGKWAPISKGDTLSLLSRNFKGINVMRQHAVEMLKRESDESLSIIMLQLVQGIRYEFGTDADKAHGILADFLLDRCCGNFDLTCKMWWYVAVEISIEVQTTPGVEVSKVFREVQKRIVERLSAHEQGKTFLAQVRRQEEFRKVLMTLNSTIRVSNDRPKQIELLKKYLSEKDCGIAELFEYSGDAVGAGMNASMAGAAGGGGGAGGGAGGNRGVGFNLLHHVQDAAQAVKTLTSGEGGGGSGAVVPDRTTMLYHPLKSDVPVVGIDPTDYYIFKSAKRPMGLKFKMPNGDTYGAIYKAGDDIRQDQLVIQMIELVDKLLKQDGMDLHLTPYRVLALSYDDGFVETVPAVKTLQDIGATGGVQAYLRSYKENLTPTGEIDTKVMENFVHSCAGYCVITYILGIGDRHLENLLVTKDGRILHIDFGFILGKDPKPFPAPMKLSKEMIEGLGGLDSRSYELFKIHCCNAYNTIRKHASLIMNLLILMLDANIPQLSGDYRNADPKLNLLKVQDKLKLDVNNAEATTFIQEVITQSANALFSAGWDRLHELATKLRA